MGRHPVAGFGYLLQFPLSLPILFDSRLLARQGAKPAGPLDDRLVRYHRCSKEGQLGVIIGIREVQPIDMFLRCLNE